MKETKPHSYKEHVEKYYSPLNPIYLSPKQKWEAFKFGITIHDNDFHSTINGFLQLLYSGYRWDIRYPTKEEIVELFNRSAAGIYWVHQNGLQYNKEWNASEYLKDPTVYVNEELDIKLETWMEWSNSDMCILDITDPNSPWIYTL